MKILLKSYKTLFVAFAAFVVVGCASNVRTKVSTFISPSASLTGASVMVKPFDASQTGALEFKFYKDILENKLKAEGFSINNANPSHIALLGYNVTRKEADGYRTGTVVFGSSFGYSNFHRNRGLVFAQRIENRHNYERLVKLTITKATPTSEAEIDNAGNIIEISARSVGSCESLPSVFEPMLDGIFKNLSRPNGSIVTVKTPSKEGGC